MCTVPAPGSPDLDDAAESPSSLVFPSTSGSRPPALPIWNSSFASGPARQATGRDAGTDLGSGFSFPVLGDPPLDLDCDREAPAAPLDLLAEHGHSRGSSGRGRFATGLSLSGQTRSGSYFTPLAEGGFGVAVDAVPPRSRAESRQSVSAYEALPPSPVGESAVSCALWEEERCIVVLVVVGDHAIARRTDADWVNSTKLLNMVDGLSRGKRDMFLKNEADRQVFRRGALHLKGVWLPLDAAARFAREFGLYDRLHPLFEPAILPYLLLPVNRPRTTQLVATARARRALLDLPGPPGLGSQQRVDLERRYAQLEAVLHRLEVGLRGGSSSASELVVRDPTQRPVHDLRPTSDAALPVHDRHPAGLRFSRGAQLRHTSADSEATGSTAPHYDRLGGRHDVTRRSMSTTVSSLCTRERRDSDASSASSFSSLEFTPLESDKGDAARAEPPAWTSSSYTLVLAPDAASCASSASTSRPVSRSRLDGPGQGLGMPLGGPPSDVEERPTKRFRPDVE